MASLRALNWRLADNNPIMQAELAYQQRSAPRYRPWRRWLGRVLRALALTLTLILFTSEVVGALLYRDATFVSDWFGAGTALLLIGVLAYHFLLLFRTLALAANTITREQHGHTWEMLVLTGVDARRIVRGKWWATVRRQWREYGLLAVLRAGVIVWYGASNSRLLAATLASYGAYYSSSHYLWIPRPAQLLLAAGLVAALTLANLAFTAAVGIAASAKMHAPVWALARALFLRLLILIPLAVLLTFLGAQFYELLEDAAPATAGIVYEWFNRLFVLLLDNGYSLGGELANYHWAQPNYPTMADNPVGYVLAAGLAGLMLYGFLTWILLRLAQRQAVQRQALPPALD